MAHSCMNFWHTDFNKCSNLCYGISYIDIELEIIHQGAIWFADFVQGFGIPYWFYVLQIKIQNND